MSPEKEDQNTSEVLQKPEKGDKILFEGRKTPLTVDKVRENELKIRGPQGGEYILYSEEDAKHPLKAKPGNKKYSSYVRNVRKVGEWQKKGEKTWAHTKSEAKIFLKKNSVGFWTIDVENFDVDLDLPKYGFSDYGNAEEEVQKLLSENPEG